MTAPVATPYFKRDAQLRARLFDARSFEHDAKANLYLLAYLVDRYTKPGDLVLDPMGGTGSLYLSAPIGARWIVCGELESWLMPILEKNRRRMSDWARRPAPVAYQGDAAKLPIASGSAAACLFSPPYWDTFSDWNVSSHRLKKNHLGPHGSAYADERGSKVKRNAGNEHVYEAYLRRMRPIYQECQRVLAPGGRLILIVKDSIHHGQRVPIVDDTVTMLRALNFRIEEVLTREAPLSLYRNIDKGLGRPVIKDEQVIVAQQREPRPVTQAFWVVMLPEIASGPPLQVYQWARHLSYEQEMAVFPDGRVVYFEPGRPSGQVVLDGDLVTSWPDPYKAAKFTLRRQASFDATNTMVLNLGLRAGDHVALFVPWRYADYLQRRLTTLGAVVEVPTKGLNMGQKMTWLKERLK